MEEIKINNKEADLLVTKHNAPFSDEVVETFNEMQKRLGLYTCMSHNDCDRGERGDQGMLRATNECLVCPCGLYKQYFI